jgi:hypothetical protein
MARKARKAVAAAGGRRSDIVYLPWFGSWPFWPIGWPASKEQLKAGEELARARGAFWSKSFDAFAELLDEWSKHARNRR